MDALLGVLDPLSTSKDVHDYKASFFLSQFLDGLARKGKVPPSLRCRIVEGFLHQLLCWELWHWA
eukprot:5395292-Prorocentrum_lima.AAC.1